MKLVKNDRGAILVFVAFALVTLFVLGTFLLDISKTDFDISKTQVARVQANYNAESIFNQVMAQLLVDEDKLMELKTIINDLPMGGNASFDLSIPIILENGGITWPNPKKYAHFTVQKNNPDDISLSTEMTGTYSGKYGKATKNLRVQSKITMADGWYFPANGSLISEGDVSLQKDVTIVDGMIYENNVQPIPIITVEDYNRWKTMKNVWKPLPNNWNGDLSLLDSGNYYSDTFSKDTYFSGNYSGHIVLAFKESISLSKNGIIAADGAADDLNLYVNNSLIVISLGDITIKKDQNFSGIYIAPNGSITVDKNSNEDASVNFVGSLISQDSIMAKKNLTLAYNSELADTFTNFINSSLSYGSLDFDIKYWK